MIYVYIHTVNYASLQFGVSQSMNGESQITVFFRHKSDERNPAPVARFVSSICFSQEKSRDLQCFLGSQWI